MSGSKRQRLYYLISVVMLTVFSGTFLLMPLSEKVSADRARPIMVLTGAVFWVSCLSGYGTLFMAYRNCRHNNDGRQRKVYVFSNIPTKIADIIFLAGLILGLVIAIGGWIGDYIVYIDIFMIVLGINMHLLFSRALYARVLVIKIKRNHEEEK